MKLYNKYGKLLPEDKEKAAFAKIENGNYFVKEYRGSLFDPEGVDSRYANKTTWRACSERCLKLYVKYLGGKRAVNYRLAEREYLTNG